ncbi:MAG: hypothetical protein CVV27_07065 [Candidatus Melainabacteria bacterium HGW-Melainabacteria-1]|nr:MAG: hypothetical protein CVV27_07065 [Candidatus Melainabacteria bacterium HGW-Melainabacteria-1]
MNKHLLILPALLVVATTLLLFSQSLPEDGEVIVVTSPTPEPVGNPSGIVPVGESPGTQPSGTPSARPTPKPSPSPSATPLPSFGIAATTPDAVLREAQIQAGRVDPFKSIFAPDLPEFVPAIEPEQLALPSLPPLDPIDSPSATAPIREPEDIPPVIEDIPPPRPALDQGLVLKGIMDGGVDPIAIIEVHGRTELVRVGDRLSGNILVTSIHFEERRVTLSRGSEKSVLTIPLPQTMPY